MIYKSPILTSLLTPLSSGICPENVHNTPFIISALLLNNSASLSTNCYFTDNYSTIFNHFGGIPCHEILIPASCFKSPGQVGAIPIEPGMMPTSKGEAPIEAGVVPVEIGYVPFTSESLPSQWECCPSQRESLPLRWEPCPSQKSYSHWAGSLARRGGSDKKIEQYQSTINQISN